MKNSCNKEEATKKYAYFSNPESTRSTKTSGGTNQCGQRRKNIELTSLDVLIEKPDRSRSKTLGNVLLENSVQPFPFTFMTAVKRKHAPVRNYPTCKKVYEPKRINEEIGGTMDYIKPLTIPDLKISSKADYSSREGLLSNEESLKKIEVTQRDEMSIKSIDRVPRKPEFSSSCTSLIFNYDNNDSLKISEFALSKKKDLSRDSSREKENRSKRVKKDDFNVCKNKDDMYGMSKWSKPQRHISRKEIADSIVKRKQMSDCILSQRSKESDIILKKSKNRNFTTSTVKKDEEKRHKYTNIPLAKSKIDKFLDFKNRTSSSDSVYEIDKGMRLHEKFLIREGCKSIISELNDRKYKDDSQIVNTSKQSDESKHKSHSETRLQKHQSKSNSVKPIDTLTRDQCKRFSEKQKSSSKLESKHSSEISEDLTTAANSVASLAKSQSIGTEIPSVILSKNKDSEKTPQSSNNRNSEECIYSDTFSHPGSSNPISSSTAIETKISQDSSLSEKLMDPSRISFREDSYSNQPEFVDLIPPDMNLMIRYDKNLSKKRKPILQTWENDNAQKDCKQRSLKNSQDIEVQMSDNKDTDSKKTEAESSESKDDGKNKIQKPMKSVEVQTQTANDIATQTDTSLCQRTINTNLAYSRVSIDRNELPHISLNSEYRYEDMDRVENITLPSKLRAMSEISLHETTSSIKTETGTEISISTRDVTYSFNKYLDLEMAQLIKDERQRYDKIEMLFKSREKTLNDRTRKLVELEEQKRALRDTGQDSRISSVKKKQRALLLKLQQEKDEMNRLKELHKIASKERKLMLQKQRDMFNPEMSTKNILNKLKRSADSQSPRRLSGPMKGYDIRSNSSVSSLVDSDKSQFDQSQIDLKLNLSDIIPQKDEQICSRVDLNRSLKQGPHSTDNADKKLLKIEASKQKEAAAAVAAAVAKLKYNLKMRKFEGKMPKSDQLKLKSQHYDMDALLKHGASAISLLKNENRANMSQDEDNKSLSEHVRSESDVLIEEFTQIWKSQFPNLHSESFNLLKTSSNSLEALEEIQKTSSTKKLDKETIKKLQQQAMSDNKNAKRKGVKGQKTKPVQTESALKYEDFHYIEENIKHNKRSKIESEQQSDENYQNSILEELDFNDSQSSLHALLKHSTLLKERNEQLLQDIVDESRHTVADNSESPLSQKDEEEHARRGNASSRSQVSLTISHQSSNDSDRSYSRSVVIRSQQDHHHHRTGLKTSKKLEQILNARETTLVSRRNCVEEWIAWHARLREEENRVIRMEQAAYKLVTASAKALSRNDTTVSSDTSDVEGRIEQLTQKLADRRLEMARLKKELRKQAKQRLKALEANLLNEIKRYDATINDMRKKLELRRGTANKEIENLAIESKSVSNIKVPEIPFKKIQDIFNCSDLLRSKSDSDIVSKKNEGKEEKSEDDNLKSSNNENNLSRTKNTIQSKHSPSLYTVCDDEHESSEKSDHSAVHSYKTKSSSDEIATQKSIATESLDIKRSSSQSSNISEDIPSEAYSIKSQPEQIKTAKTPEILSSQVISERIEYGTSEECTKTDLKENSNIEEEIISGSHEVSLIFTKKLDNIQLNNKELNDDIHNLENDLKELTKLMSSFSKSSDDKNSKSVEISDVMKNTEKSTCKDISEELPGFQSITKTDNIEEELQARVQTILSDVIPETDELLNSIEEFHTNAEVIEKVIEKFILPECINKSTIAEEISTNLPSQTEIINASSGFNHKNTDSYISEILSTAGDEDKENTTPNESHYLPHRISKSPDCAINTEIETELSDSKKLNSKNIDENKINEVVALRETKDNSANEVISLKTVENEFTENKINTSSKDKYSYTETFTVDDTSINDEASLIIEERASIHDEIITELDNKSPEPKTSISEEIDTNHIISTKENGEQTTENHIDIQMNHELPVVENISKNILENVNEEVVENEIHSEIGNKCAEIEIYVTDEVNNSIFEEKFTNDVGAKTAATNNEWSLSDSFSFEDLDEKELKVSDLKFKNSSNLKCTKSEDGNEISAFDDSAMFLPKGESTNIQDTFELKLDDSTGSHIGIRSDEFNDILDIIERETKSDDNIPNQILVVEEKNDSIVAVKSDSPINGNVFSKDELVVIEDVKITSEAENVEEKQELPKPTSESSENGELDTPRGVSEIDMDSPRDFNEDSRLDVDGLDDDLLSGNSLLLRTHDSAAEPEFRTTPMGATSEKDIRAMIDKLKVSLDQPGLEVKELDAKLLQLEHLEIELEIKKLEAEESYYVREIPNKPPPPYTPPGAVRHVSSHGSPSPPPVVIPTSVEELTAITEKATAIIFKAKEAGEDVLQLEAPTEFCELAKDNNDTLKNDRRIYNTFMFDLCKELIAEVYKSENEGPGPSWTKPNIQTKPTMKTARTLEELNDYVSREVATLFGFKTKLQRENMVMRWSRKKRDMVDELLAKEAQAEEKEWTKFHHDELTVKNKLTIRILDTILLETATCVRTTYAKKHSLAAT